MAESSTAVIASANNLSVKYGTQIVLNGATIAFREGEHIGLVGRNGSGKSTFLQIAAGLAQPRSGEFTPRRDLAPHHMPTVFGFRATCAVRPDMSQRPQRGLVLSSDY